MTKKVAVFNDMSGFGRCSLTAAIPVLSALGVQCNPIPTVILTGQGGYTVKYRQEMTDMLPEFTKAWKANHVKFDGIYTGYTSGAKQIDYISAFLKEFRQNDTFLLVDPVMGDNGHTYCSFSEELLASMKELVTEANLITPNLTEACLLLDESFAEVSALSSKEDILEKVISLAQTLRQRAIVSQDVLITGVKIPEENDWHIYNVALTDEGVSTYSSHWYEKSFSGTGDLFSSCMCGLRMNGYSTKESVKIAGNFLNHSICNTMREDSDPNDGIEFEKHLNELVIYAK